MTMSFLRALAGLAALALAGCAGGAAPRMIPAGAPETAASDYYSPSAEEAVLEFDGVHKARLTDEADATPVNPGDVQWEVSRLMLYLGGPMGEAAVKAGPKYDGKTEILGYDRLGHGWYNIRYHFRGTFTIERTHGATYRVLVPRDVATLYARAQAPGATEAARNPCTNSWFTSEYYFWYFWNPDAKGCPLRAGVDYDAYDATVTPIPNVLAARYPDYPRLVGADGVLPVSIMFGANEDEYGTRPPEGNPDYNAANFLDVERRLVAAGFTKHRLSAGELATFCPGADATVSELRRDNGARHVVVRMLWGATHPGHHAEGFACVLNEALAGSAVMIYSAHSGLGQSIYLQEFREESHLPLVVNPARYQLFAFNSCSSYGYYNADFFRDKRTPADPGGAANLDVITSGTSTDFDKIAHATWDEVKPVLDWSRGGAWTSYQDIVDRIDQGTLTGVSGIRDNPRQPYR